MAYEFILPDIGEGVHEGEIVSWLVNVGDQIAEDQPMVEVMTDKATVEIPSPVAGTVLQLNGAEGEIVFVGNVLIVIGEAGEAIASSNDKKAEAPAAPVVETAAPAAGSSNGAPPATSGTAPVAASSAAPSGRVLATPSTRKFAREMNIDIKLVTGSGPAGRVTDDDVKAFAEGGVATTATATAPAPGVAAPSTTPDSATPTPATAATPTPPPVRRVLAGETEERMPLRGVRKVISDHMIHSTSTHSHFTFVDEVDMTELVKVRKELKPVAEKMGVKLTFLPFIVKAVVGALRKHPTLNASVDFEKEEIILKNYYNIGIAAATDAGLMVPVIKAADQLSMIEIGVELDRLGTAAKSGKVALEDLQGSTFTITSLGADGGLFATPIINSPESAILGIHEIKKRPVVIDNDIVIRDIMNIALSFDHRLIDGHIGAAFAKEIKRFLEDPKWLLVGA
jgi:pyruvate dehydrogenase E2 component (dihydrolipoamide acetyltransferase)